MTDLPPADSREGSSAATVDPLDAVEAKWTAEPGDAEEWERRAKRALALARRWRGIAGEWEVSARKQADRGR